MLQYAACAVLMVRITIIWLAKTTNGLYKTGVIRHRGPWRNVDDVTLEWVDWFNNRRLSEPIETTPLAEFEMAYYYQSEESELRSA